MKFIDRIFAPLIQPRLDSINEGCAVAIRKMHSEMQSQLVGIQNGYNQRINEMMENNQKVMDSIHKHHNQEQAKGEAILERVAVALEKIATE